MNTISRPHFRFQRLPMQVEQLLLKNRRNRATSCHQHRHKTRREDPSKRKCQLCPVIKNWREHIPSVSLR